MAERDLTSYIWKTVNLRSVPKIDTILWISQDQNIGFRFLDETIIGYTSYSDGTTVAINLKSPATQGAFFDLTGYSAEEAVSSIVSHVLSSRVKDSGVTLTTVNIETETTHIKQFSTIYELKDLVRVVYTELSWSDI